MKIPIFGDYYPHPGQVRIDQCNARFINVVAGRRFGKDFGCARKFVKRIFLQDYPKIAHIKLPTQRFIKFAKPLLHYWAIAPDFNIGKIQQREIFSIFPPDFQASPSHFSYDDNKKELILLGGKILIEFKSADRPESLVGVGLNGVYCTEFARFKETAWSANIRPTLTDKQGWGLFATTPLPRKWFMDIVALGNPESDTYSASHANIFGLTIENTRLPNIVEEVAVAKATLPPRYFKREYEASLETFEGQVYEEWDQQVHAPLDLVLPKFDIVVAGVDWGFGDPGVIIVAGIKFRKGTPVFYLIHEEYESGVLVDGDDDTWVRRAKRLRDKYGIKIFYCDSAEPGNIRAFRNAGLNAVKADKKEINDGIQSVAMALHVNDMTGLPSLYIVREKCPNTMREHLQYYYEKPEVPVDEENHTCDTVRYIVHTFLKTGGMTGYEVEGLPQD